MIKAEGGARILMCAPEHFAVSYAINPWMDPGSWARDDIALGAAARREWAALHTTLSDLGAAIELLPPSDGVPDLVFTANSAVVLDGIALLARFRHAERRREEPHVETAFRRLQAHGLIDAVRLMPEGVALEGAGDCVFDSARNLFWMGYGPRSDLAARPIVAETFGQDVVALELADPRFYHMDTAFSPLPRGETMYVPDAFTAEGLATIRQRVHPEQRIELADDDAVRLAANAVAIGDTIVMSSCSNRLRSILRERGYRVRTTGLASFLRSGGSAFCLTLRLDRRSAAASNAGRRTAVA
jgi:arginine dihydrolase